MIKLWIRYSAWCETSDREVYALYCHTIGIVIGAILGATVCYLIVGF